MAVQGHWIVVERRDVGLAARQPGGHVTYTAVRAYTVMPLDVRRFRHWFLKTKVAQFIR